MPVDRKSRTIYLKNMRPGFLNASITKTNREISEFIEKQGIKKSVASFFRGKKVLYADFDRRKEEFKQEIEKEINEKGPAEVSFLESFIDKKAKDCISAFFARNGITMKPGSPPAENIPVIPFEVFIGDHEKYLGE